MPITTIKKPVVVSIATSTKEWEVVEELRGHFVTMVKDKNGQPKVNPKGEQQVRRPSGDDIVRKMIKAFVLDAPAEVLDALAA